MDEHGAVPLDPFDKAIDLIGGHAKGEVEVELEDGPNGSKGRKVAYADFIGNSVAPQERTPYRGYAPQGISKRQQKRAMQQTIKRLNRGLRKAIQAEEPLGLPGPSEKAKARFSECLKGWCI